MTATTSDSATVSRPRLVAAIVAVAFFMQALDGTIIATSLPAMAADFRTDVVSLNVGFTAYLLAMAVCIPPAGWLADRWGARNVFLGAIVLFTLSSLACAMAEGLWSFAAARIAQGVGGALMTPVGRQIVLRNTPKSELVDAIALITWPALIAPVIGPVLGGWITTHAGWRWNFLLNLPIGAIGVALTLAFMAGGDRETPRPFDRLGFLWTSAALALILVGLELLSQDAGVLAGLLTVLGLGFGWLAVRHLRRAAYPLVDLRVLSTQTFAISSLVTGTVARMVINATPFLLPLLFQVGMGLSAVETGTLMLVYFLGNLSMKVVTTRTLRHFGFRTLLVANGILASASVAAFAFVDTQTPRVLLLVLLFVAGLTRSMQFTALNTITFADVEAHERGAATTFSSMTQQLSVLLAVAGAALLIRLSVLAGTGTMEADAMLPDFQIAIGLMGAIGILTSLRFLVLPHDAGAEVSGTLLKAVKAGQRK
ncbi:MFS transporter [Aureimonas jatrophae]|uniref:Drug resistance transporter, EmrB/QacA subfamily n=1 Tax=Aureimonas jatrophae TaxID=1166073 RepID=A0A1H0C658_9HYPH|nr:MFS transporter [Aureimonas jatrophae]MBB3949084.1 EmrB/QacA subfamily drug resistance transporter [Aureimonas jatrophae]SDN53335.1 drug resistance transporter, EmrB/QacA subfamily [Aureimonas jatrophae]